VSAADVELIRRGYRDWNRGDLEAVAELLDPEVIFSGLTNMPDRGPHHGRTAVRRWLEELGQTWERMSAGEPELIDAGGRVVAVVRLAGRGMRSGVDIGGGTDVHVWSLDGRRITGLRMLHAGEAIDLAGLEAEEWEALTGTSADERGEDARRAREKLSGLDGA